MEAMVTSRGTAEPDGDVPSWGGVVSSAGGSAKADGCWVDRRPWTGVAVPLTGAFRLGGSGEVDGGRYGLEQLRLWQPSWLPSFSYPCGILASPQGA